MIRTWLLAIFLAPVLAGAARDNAKTADLTKGGYVVTKMSVEINGENGYAILLGPAIDTPESLCLQIQVDGKTYKSLAKGQWWQPPVGTKFRLPPALIPVPMPEKEVPQKRDPPSKRTASFFHPHPDLPRITMLTW